MCITTAARGTFAVPQELELAATKKPRFAAWAIGLTQQVYAAQVMEKGAVQETMGRLAARQAPRAATVSAAIAKQKCAQPLAAPRINASVIGTRLHASPTRILQTWSVARRTQLASAATTLQSAATPSIPSAAGRRAVPLTNSA